MTYVCDKALPLSSICNKCGSEDENIFKKEESIEILKIIALIEIYNYFKDISQEFRLKNIDERRNHFLEETKQNELASRKHKKAFASLNHIEHFLILASAVAGYVPISAFASLIGIPIVITSSAIALKICVITAGIKRYMSVIKKSKKKHDKIVVLAKSKLSRIEDVISKTLIDSNVSQGELVLINIVVKEYNGMKEEIISLKTWIVWDFSLFIRQCDHFVWNVKKCRKSCKDIKRKNNLFIKMCRVC